MISGPENMLVAVVDVDKIALAVVDDCTVPITLIVPAAVEDIHDPVNAVTFPVTDITPTLVFDMANVAACPDCVGVVPIMLPVTLIDPMPVLLMVGPAALPAAPNTLPVIFIVPKLLTIPVLLFPLANTDEITFPIMFKIPVDALIWPVWNPRPELNGVCTLPITFMVPVDRLCKHMPASEPAD